LSGDGPKAKGRARPRFLVVDDEPMVREVLAEILDLLGGESLVAASGEEALEIVRTDEGPLRAAFVDVRMPGISGLACVLSLRRLRPGVPCVVMSGLAAEEISGAIPSGVQWLAKPFVVEDVRRALRELPPGEPAPPAG
jgi:CheY-like chemotaxis protein